MNQHLLSAWLLFSHSKIAYQLSIKTLLEHYDDPAAFLGQYEGRLLTPGPAEQEMVETACRWVEAAEENHILTFNDPTYPLILKEIVHPPPVLYVKGDPTLLGAPQLAIVGSRQPSYSAQSITQQLTRELVQAGLTITSGLALGIDSISHQAALDAKGQTIAVLGHGLFTLYPKRHAALADAITQSGNGCLVSEFALNAGIHKRHFPQRNRIISGLSLGTLVIEAKIHSGSLITARCAADQGRDVFAVPGSIRHLLARGCHQLIREGAVLTETAADILETLGVESVPAREAPALPPKATAPPSDTQQKALLDCIDPEGTAIDEIIMRSGLSAKLVACLLLNLELHGYITPFQHGYQRTSE